MVKFLFRLKNFDSYSDMIYAIDGGVFSFIFKNNQQEKGFNKILKSHKFFSLIKQTCESFVIAFFILFVGRVQIVT